MFYCISTWEYLNRPQTKTLFFTVCILRYWMIYWFIESVLIWKATKTLLKRIILHFFLKPLIFRKKLFANSEINVCVLNTMTADAWLCTLPCCSITAWSYRLLAFAHCSSVYTETFVDDRHIQFRDFRCQCNLFTDHSGKLTIRLLKN